MGDASKWTFLHSIFASPCVQELLFAITEVLSASRIIVADVSVLLATLVAVLVWYGLEPWFHWYGVEPWFLGMDWSHGSVGIDWAMVLLQRVASRGQ